jgi:hypothetical protein
MKRKPFNKAATELYKYGQSVPIVGIALLVDTKLELDGPDEEDENEKENYEEYEED